MHIINVLMFTTAETVFVFDTAPDMKPHSCPWNFLIDAILGTTNLFSTVPGHRAKILHRLIEPKCNLPEWILFPVPWSISTQMKHLLFYKPCFDFRLGISSYFWFDTDYGVRRVLGWTAWDWSNLECLVSQLQIVSQNTKCEISTALRSLQLSLHLCSKE